MPTACSCDPIGSLSTSCDRLGQCVCKPGVGGLTCNTCLAGYFNQSDRGCEKCGCDEVGSEGVACDEEGACLCREGVRGRRCDECDVGYFNLTERGCRLAIYTNCCQGHGIHTRVAMLLVTFLKFCDLLTQTPFLLSMLY